VLSLGWGIVYISLAMFSSSDSFISSINKGSSKLLTQPMSCRKAFHKVGNLSALIFPKETHNLSLH